ncbi:MAG TPA: septum formation initiator [Bacteroidales bacterium]|jgi:cell division protein DivIC|nr:septum formation initiator [Bacteroidales bacterium]
MPRNFNLKKFLPVLRNKYVIAAFAFFVWVFLFDENNLIERYQLSSELRQIDKDRKYYIEKIEEDAARLKELQTNDENLEKFAREQYLMKRDNEDVFVVVRD